LQRKIPEGKGDQEVSTIQSFLNGLNGMFSDFDKTRLREMYDKESEWFDGMRNGVKQPMDEEVQKAEPYEKEYVQNQQDSKRTVLEGKTEVRL
jgi:hypothetical protein